MLNKLQFVVKKTYKSKDWIQLSKHFQWKCHVGELKLAKTTLPIATHV